MKAIDLFSGCGGMSLGFEKAGIEVVCAIERDPGRAQTYQKNFPETVVLAESLDHISVERLREITGEADVIFGGPPCQGFSFQGKRDSLDGRSLLIWQFARIVAGMRPVVFVMENVPGIRSGEPNKMFECLISFFNEQGYYTETHELNAQNYGVPQSRKRIFVVGVLDRSIKIRKPQAISRVNVWDAIGDLDIPESTQEDIVPISWLEEPSRYVKALNDGRAVSRISGMMKIKHSSEIEDRFNQIAPGTRDPIGRHYRLTKDGVCPTLLAGSSGDKGTHSACRPIHPTRPRCITVRESARLHSFPDWFEFYNSKHGANIEIGNSVCPLLSYAIAKEIMVAHSLEVKPSGINDLTEATNLRELMYTA